MKTFIATSYKELTMLKGRIRAFLFSTISFFILLMCAVYFFTRNSTLDIEILGNYVQFYMGVVGFLYSMRFWEEKICGTMELYLFEGFTYKSFIIYKSIFYLLIGIIVSLSSRLIMSLIYLEINFKLIILVSFVYSIIILPYGIINGIAMTSLKKGIASIFQYISIIIIFSSIGLIKILTNNCLSYVLFGLLLLSFLMWLTAITMLLRSNAEKAIITEFE
jgi:membrane protein